MNTLINRQSYLEQLLIDDGVSEDHIIHTNLESLKYRELTDYLSFYESFFVWIFMSLMLL